MAASEFEQLRAEVAARGADEGLEQLAAQFKAEGKFHELFDTRLMMARRRLGLPLVAGTSIDELPEPLRTQTEDAYMNACREVGELLAEQGKLREAWMYLRPTGEKERLAARLAAAEVNDENMEELIEVALHEGIAPAVGFQIVLDRYGTCNAITTFENALPQQTPAVQTLAAELLVHHLHRELTENVRSHVEDKQPGAAEGKTLGELVSEQAWVFENDGYHIDLSHLASTVRYARLVTKPEVVDKAWQLTEYGRRLAASYQFEGEEPFAELYPTHGLLFAAMRGERVDEAVAYFGDKAATIDAKQEGTAAIETYLILLDRLGRAGEALDAYGKLAPAGAQLSPYCPRPFELAEKSGAWGRYLEICQSRGDLLGFAAGLAGEKR